MWYVVLRNILAVLSEMFSKQLSWSMEDTAWPPLSPNLNPLDLYLWGHLKPLCMQLLLTTKTHYGCLSDYPHLHRHLWTDAAVHDETCRGVHWISCIMLWRIRSKQELWRQRNSCCWVMARTHAAEECVMYAVTSRNNWRGVVSGVLWVRATLVAMQPCGKHISAAVNQHAIIEEEVFSVDPPWGYITRISRS
jgi:hypothetical protein